MTLLCLHHCPNHLPLPFDPAALTEFYCLGKRRTVGKARKLRSLTQPALLRSSFIAQRAQSKMDYGYIPTRPRRRSSLSDIRYSGAPGLFSFSQLPITPGPAGFDTSPSMFSSRSASGTSMPGIDPLLTYPPLSRDSLARRGAYTNGSPSLGAPGHASPVTSASGSRPSRRKGNRSTQQTGRETGLASPSLPPLTPMYDLGPGVRAPIAGLHTQSSLGSPSLAPLNWQATSGNVLQTSVELDRAFQPLPSFGQTGPQPGYATATPAPALHHAHGLATAGTDQSFSFYPAPSSVPPSWNNFSSGPTSSAMSRGAQTHPGYPLRRRRSIMDLQAAESSSMSYSPSSSALPSLSASGSVTPVGGRRFGTVTRSNMHGLISRADVDRSWPGEWGDGEWIGVCICAYQTDA